MAKAKGKRDRKGSTASFFGTDDETISTISSSDSSELSMTSPEFLDITSEESQLDSDLDALFEKRSSTRETGLSSLSKSFTSAVQTEFTDNKGETLLQQCSTILKRGSSSEISLAAHLLGLLVLTTGEGNLGKMIFEDASPQLTRIAKTGSHAASRISALKSLAVLSFVAGTDEDSENILKVLWEVSSYDKTPGISTPNPEVRAAALNSWALLLTTASKRYVDSLQSECFPVLLQLLKVDDRAVRLAAGEGIMAILESSSFNPSDNENPLEDENLSKVDDVINQMKDLSVEAGGKGTSKKDLGSQRSFFSDVVAYIQEGIEPDVTIKFGNHDSLNITSWTQLIQMNMLRSFLGGGFQIHMLDNPFMHEVFGFAPKETTKKQLTKLEKRMYFSPNSVVSKSRTQELNKRRDRARVGNYGHYDANDE